MGQQFKTILTKTNSRTHIFWKNQGSSGPNSRYHQHACVKHCLSFATIIPITFKEGCKLFVYGVATQTPKEDLQAEFERFQKIFLWDSILIAFWQAVINLWLRDDGSMNHLQIKCLLGLVRWQTPTTVEKGKLQKHTFHFPWTLNLVISPID